MDSSDITTERAEQIQRSLFRLHNYLCRLTRRMERGGFPPTDPLFQATTRAYDAVNALSHYMACKSGVYRPRREDPAGEERKHGRFRGEP